MERAILVPIEIPYKHFPNLCVSKMSAFNQQNFPSKLAFD